MLRFLTWGHTWPFTFWFLGDNSINNNNNKLTSLIANGIEIEFVLFLGKAEKTQDTEDKSCFNFLVEMQN